MELLNHVQSEWSQHLNAGAGSMLFAVMFVTAAIYSASLVRSEWKDHHTLIGIFTHPWSRMVLGFSFILLGAAIMIGGWIVPHALFHSGAYVETVKWLDYSYLWVEAGVMTSLAGMVMLMWSAIWSRFGVFSIPVVIVGAALMYFAGVLVMIWLSRNMPGVING